MSAEEKEGRRERTTFDARLQYYDVLKSLMTAISKARVYGEERARLNAIDELFIFVSAFISDTARQAEIETHLEVARRSFEKSELLSRRDPTFQHERFRLRNLASKELSKVHMMLYAVLKERGMLLPMSQQDTDLFDEDRFMRESDL